MTIPCFCREEHDWKLIPGCAEAFRQRGIEFFCAEDSSMPRLTICFAGVPMCRWQFFISNRRTRCFRSVWSERKFLRCAFIGIHMRLTNGGSAGHRCSSRGGYSPWVRKTLCARRVSGSVQAFRRNLQSGEPLRHYGNLLGMKDQRWLLGTPLNELTDVSI